MVIKSEYLKTRGIFGRRSRFTNTVCKLDFGASSTFYRKYVNISYVSYTLLFVRVQVRISDIIVSYRSWANTRVPLNFIFHLDHLFLLFDFLLSTSMIRWATRKSRQSKVLKMVKQVVNNLLRVRLFSGFLFGLFPLFFPLFPELERNVSSGFPYFFFDGRKYLPKKLLNINCANKQSF